MKKVTQSTKKASSSVTPTKRPSTGTPRKSGQTPGASPAAGSAKKKASSPKKASPSKPASPKKTQEKATPTRGRPSLKKVTSAKRTPPVTTAGKKIVPVKGVSKIDTNNLNYKKAGVNKVATVKPSSPSKQKKMPVFTTLTKNPPNPNAPTTSNAKKISGKYAHVKSKLDTWSNINYKATKQ